MSSHSEGGIQLHFVFEFAIVFYYLLCLFQVDSGAELFKIQVASTLHLRPL
jgi:hypothetical protein